MIDIWDFLKKFDFKEVDSREMLKSGKQPNQTNFSMFFSNELKHKIKEIKHATRVFSSQRGVVIFCISFVHDLFVNNQMRECEVELKEYFKMVDNFSANQGNKNFSVYFTGFTKNKINKIKNLINEGLIQNPKRDALVYFCILMSHEIICKKRLNHEPSSNF